MKLAQDHATVTKTADAASVMSGMTSTTSGVTATTHGESKASEGEA